MAQGHVVGAQLNIDSQTSHFVRITSGGKMKLWVEFSLKFFRENPGKPLIFHTLPSSSSTTSDSVLAPSETDHVDEEVDDRLKKQNKTCPTTTNIPRLISVVEIIKREYFKTREPGPQSTGLYQYNTLGSLEERGAQSGDDPTPLEDERRQKKIATVLEGRNFPKLERTPYMKITLCTTSIPAMESNTNTIQVPPIKKISRSAKARQKRRLKKQPETNTKEHLAAE
ncbi:hypothetical protein DFH11DRAFT_1570478 [Phellopilus nigrolimitatus]|nr:hypothetical protein DFH11DRAFT_1570478 [Phellopilus nigrolimitatus]